MNLSRRVMLAGGLSIPGLLVLATQVAAQAGAKTFMVYFPSGVDGLTADATAVVDAAAGYAVDKGMHAIDVIGHADTAEPDPEALSLKRAQTIRERLLAKGLGAGIVSASGVGAHDLAVSTGPGTAEPLNRRVIIRIH